MHRLDITRDAWKFLADLEPKRYKQVVSKMLALLSDPTPNDSETLKGSDKRRCDIGEYRIIYSFSAEVVSVALIGKRNDDEAYRDMKRKGL